MGKRPGEPLLPRSMKMQGIVPAASGKNAPFAFSRTQRGLITFSTTPSLRALLRQPTDYTPIWLMRQAGRYLPEYNATRARARSSFLGLAKSPAYATEVTLQPLETLSARRSHPVLPTFSRC